MNLTINSQLLAQELRLVCKVAATKPTIPMLGNVMLSADTDLHLSATDMEISMRTRCACAVKEQGSTTVPAKKFLETIEQLPNADVGLSLGTGVVMITCGSFKSRLQTLPPQDFPSIPDMSGDVVSVSAKALHRLIDRTEYAISDSVQKYILDGALMSISESFMAMVAIDGKRLSIATAAKTDGPKASFIIPSKTLSALTAMSENGEVQCSFTDKHLFFLFDKRLLVSRMIDGEFPKYDRIIPKDCNKQATIDRLTFAAALRRVGVVSDEGTNIDMLFGEGALTLTSGSAGVGDADESMLIGYEGEPVKVTVNGRHVLDFLDKATQAHVTASLKTSISPLLLTDGQDFLNVVMVRR